MVSVTPLRLTGRGWLPGPICVCPAFVGAPSSPRHFQQDLAATEEMLHRVLDMLEGVHARHGDNKGAVGHQRCRLTNDRHHLVAVVEVADKESADREVLADRAEWKPSRTAASGACAVRRRYSCRHREESAPLTAPSPVEPIPTIWRGCLGCWLRLTNAAHDRASCGVHEGTSTDGTKTRQRFDHAGRPSKSVKWQSDPGEGRYIVALHAQQPGLRWIVPHEQ